MRPREEENVPGQPALPARWPSSIDSCSGIGNSKLSPVDKETHLVISDDAVSAEKDKRRAKQAVCPAPDERAPHAVSSPLWYSASPLHPSPIPSGLPPGPLQTLPSLESQVTSNASASKNFLIQPGGPELLLPFAPSSFHLLHQLRHPVLPWDSPAGPWLWEVLPQAPYPGDYLPSYK